MKTSKVTKVEFKAERDTKYGTQYSYWVEMENGDKGFYNSKKNPQTNFIEGKEADYTLETLEKKDKSGTYTVIKPFKEFKTTYDKKASGGPYSKGNKDYKAMCLSYAKDITLANHGGDDYNKLAEITTGIADIFYNWINKEA